MNDDTRRHKRRQKIAKNPKNVQFEDLQRLLEDYDFELKRTKGSHHSFTGYIGDEKTTIVIPYRRPLKAVYVKKVLAILDEIEQLDEADASDEPEESETQDDE
jgi:predicted RNA binding protein YcfA (HicA-like mRNA interferase family)